ncbi:hypothetical protein [Paenibacillus polymyxa]|uniref:hypothetical protein n=1 Tax=Paenibacillus polymyxa TaxID=1406 RepID=UPI0020196427|nr:hypothetical protein [Paenibacillus polymyxa]UQQ36918.1 hypothetical protein LMH85_08425 [Paenibacillus polymyxa]
MSPQSYDIVAYQEQDHEAVCKLLVESFKAKFQALVTLEDHFLAFAQQFTVESGFHALTLHVAHQNQQAIRLYHNLAFEIEQSQYNYWRHFWFKEPVWHLMSWKERNCIRGENSIEKNI